MSQPVDKRGPGRTAIVKVVWANIVIVGLFMATTLGWLLPQGADFFMDGKKEKLSEQTDIVWSLLERLEVQVRQGKLTLEAAQARAAEEVEQLRYGAEMKDYFWINDIKPVMIMHPYRPDLVGQDLGSFRDVGGKLLFLEMVTMASEEGEGFVEYQWERPDALETVAAKLSHVRLFRQWGWIIGTGVYLDDIAAEMLAKRQVIIAVYVGLALVGISMVWLFGSHLSRHIRQAVTMDIRDGANGLDIRKGGSFRLQTAILAIIIPAMVAMTTASCFLVYRQLYDIIQVGFDRKLHAISSVTGCFINGADHADLASLVEVDDTEAILAAEESSLYQRYIVPMRRIMAKSRITYLYTQTLETRPYCRYVLDATTGEEHTPIGYRDTLPVADYRGAEKVLRHGIVYVGGIEPTELWGLIKSAFAPIYNQDGTIMAMAGADVNISVIKAKTRVALFAVGFTGLVVVMIAGFLTMILARRLTRPLAVLKDGMLKMAAGHYDHRIQEQGPWEVRRLTVASNRIGETMADRLARMQATYREMMTSTRHRDLIMTLEALMQREAWTGVTVAWLAGEGPEKTASGWIHVEDRALFWLAAAVSDPVACLRLRHDVSRIASRLIEHGSEEEADLLATLASLVKLEIHTFFSFQRGSGRLYYLTHRSIEIGRQVDEGWQKLTVEGKGILTMTGEEDRLVITDQSALLDVPLYTWLSAGEKTSPPVLAGTGTRQAFFACLQNGGSAVGKAKSRTGGTIP